MFVLTSYGTDPWGDSGPSNFLYLFVLVAFFYLRSTSSLPLRAYTTITATSRNPTLLISYSELER